MAVATLVALDEAKPVEFSEGDTTRKVSPSQWLQDLIANAKPQVNFGEFAGGAGAAQIQPGVAHGKSDAEVDKAAQAYSKQHKVDYSEALRAVIKRRHFPIEIMLTSVPSREIMGGKIIGNLGVGLTQIAVWVLLLGVVGFFFRDKLGFLTDINLSGGYLLISVALMILSFIFSAALMATIGAAMTSSEESQGIIGLMVLPMMFPFYFLTVFLSYPNGILARVLSFFPLSAPLALSLRMAFSSVSALEIGLVFVVIVFFTLLMFWLAGVVFKRGMLRYSKRLSLKEIFSKEVRNA